MKTEDGHIISKCLDGDKVAYGLLVDKYKESIYALAYSKLGNFHDAEDITQEVFLKAYQKLHTLKRWDSFLAWLYSITSNMCKNWVRKQSRRPDSYFAEEQDPTILDDISANSYHSEIASESINETLHETLSSLPSIYRQTVSLYYLADMDTREIARFLGTSNNVIEQRLKRARAKLKEEMVTMMTASFEQGKLRAGFTFGIIEMVKRLKIQKMPRFPWLPWGIPVASTVMIAVLITFNLASYDPINLNSGFMSEAKLNSQVDQFNISSIYLAPHIQKGEMLSYVSVPVSLGTISAGSDKKPDKLLSDPGAIPSSQDSQKQSEVAIRGPIRLQLKPWVGEEQTYQANSETKTVVPTGWTIVAKLRSQSTSICLGVDNDGIMKIIRFIKLGEPEQTMENVPPDQMKMIEESTKRIREEYPYLKNIVTIVRMRPDGTIVDGSLPTEMITGSYANGQVSDMLQKYSEQLAMFPDKPINVGESWTQQLDKNDPISSIKSTLAGFEDINNQKCAKIQSEMTMKISVGDMSAKMTDYFSIEDGLSIKSIAETNNQITGQGTTTSSQINELTKRRKLTPDEFKTIQEESAELEVAFAYLKKLKLDNPAKMENLNLAKETLQKFAHAHPQSRFKDGIEGIIIQMDTVKKMEEELYRRQSDKQERKTKETQQK